MNKIKRLITLYLSLGLAFSASPALASPSMQAEVKNEQTDTIAYSNANQRYGSWLFTGGFKGQSFSAINPEYRITQGDKLLIQVWGGVDYQADVSVDAQGNIFIPKVGPIKVLGVKNSQLNQVVLKSVKRVYKSNVEVYVSLMSSQKVKVFLSGMVVKPGLYEGQSADSVLRFIDQAGGIRPDMGSYRNIEVKRNNKTKYQLDLYAFLEQGEMPAIQLQDGDVIFIGPKQAEVTLEGEVGFEGKYELAPKQSLQSVLDAVVVGKDATHITVIAPQGYRVGAVREVVAKQYPINQIAAVDLHAGALIKVSSHLKATSISIELIGEHDSSQEMVLPWGSSLADLLNQVSYNKLSNKQAVQLYRESLAKRQKDMLNASLTALEQSVMTARSETKDAALLRQAEAEVILQWVAKAREAEPRGQVLLSGGYDASKIILNQGDKIVIPAKRNLVLIHGEVLFPTAIAYNDRMTILDFIDKSGGTNQDIDDMNILVMKPNGSFVDANDMLDERREIEPGDEIFVLAKPDFKGFQLTMDISELIYQLAVSTAVVLAL